MMLRTNVCVGSIHVAALFRQKIFHRYWPQHNTISDQRLDGCKYQWQNSKLVAFVDSLTRRVGFVSIGEADIDVHRISAKPIHTMSTELAARAPIAPPRLVRGPRWRRRRSQKSLSIFASFPTKTGSICVLKLSYTYCTSVMIAPPAFKGRGGHS